MDKIQLADPAARRWAIWITFIAVAFGSVILLALNLNFTDVEAWLDEHIEFLLDNIYLIVICAFIFVSPIIAGCIYLLILGNRTITNRRYPPHGYAVSRDTRVIEGRSAIRRGRIIQFISILLIAAAVSIPVVIGYIFYIMAAMLS